MTEGLLARLRAEEDEDQVPAQALRAVSELLQAQGQGDLPAVLGFALEVREYLLVERRVDLVVELARLVRAALGAQPEAAAAFLEAWLDARTLAAIVAAQPPGRERAGAPARGAPRRGAPATIDRLFDLLAAEGDGPRAPLLRLLVARSCRHAPEALVARLRGASGEAAVALFRLLETVDPQAAHASAVEATSGGEPLLQREALRHLGAAPFTPEIARALHHLVESRTRAVRLAALPVMAARGGPRVFAALLAHVEKHAARLGTAEAEAAGQAARVLVAAARPSRRSRRGCTRRAGGCSASW